MENSLRNQFDTPCLVVDQQILRKNILEMQQEAQVNGCKLRPHIKTHKIPHLAKMQIAAGACGITSCKVSEAEVMADSGLSDIFIAYPLVGAEKLRRACMLSKKIQRLILAVDSIEQTKPLVLAAESNNCQMEVRIEVDCGGGRTGVELEHFTPLVKFVESLPILKLTGLYTFRGLNGGFTDPAISANLEVKLLEQYKVIAEDICGRKLEISGGSTPTGREVSCSEIVTEIRPGTYIFNDYMIHKECNVTLDRIAAKLLVTVISVHSNYAVIDGGCKTFPTDISLNQSPYYFESYAYFPDRPQLRLTRLSEEHGMITAADGPLGLQVGDILEAIPLHICPAVNLQNKIYLVDEENIRVEKVLGRGMVQ